MKTRKTNEVIYKRKKDSKDIMLVNNNKSKTVIETKTIEAKKTDKKASKVKVNSVNVKRMKNTYKDFAEFKKVMQNLDNKCAFTLHENRLLLISRTLENHLKAIIEFRLSVKEYKDNKHIMNVSKLRNHIKWLTDRNFVFTENKQKQIKISNYVKA